MVQSKPAKRARSPTGAKSSAKKPKVTLAAYPQLLKEWHPTKNGDLDPLIMARGSGKKVWWKCQVKNCQYEWETKITHRTAGRKCVICSRVSDNNRFSLKADPDVLSEWHNVKNGNLNPNHFALFSPKRVWWKCKTCSHEWNMPIYQRSRGCGCKCQGKTQQHHKQSNQLSDLNRFSIHGDERLKEEWCHSKNELKPSEITVKSRRKVWWRCKDCLYEWQSPMISRTKHPGCPACKRLVLSDLNRFSLHADQKLVDEWHPHLNEDLRCCDVTIKSGKKVWWMCSVKTCKYEWQAKVGHRVEGAKCPACLGKVVTDKNRLSLDPRCEHLIKEWHKNRNGKLEPKDVSVGCVKKVWWKCSRKECGYEWKTYISNRARGKRTGCPHCSGHCLTDKNRFSLHGNPKLLEEWHKDKNFPLTPSDVTKNTGRKVWWKCSIEDCQHVWKTTINSRSNGKGCPSCAGQTLSDKNRFSLHAPAYLQKEWHVEKNLPLTPSDVTIACKYRIWWKCQKEKCGHVWQCSMGSRTSHFTGCPRCKAPKREQAVLKELLKMDELDVKTQDTIKYEDDSTTRTDFTVTFPNGNRLIIETDGEQHFDPDNYFIKKVGPKAYEKLLKRDRKQDMFCLKQGDHVLRIPYTTKFEDIPTILQNAIDLCKSCEKPTITYIDHKLYEKHFLSKDGMDFIENKL